LVALTGYQGDTAIQFIFSFIFFQTAGGLSLGADNPNIASTHGSALSAVSLRDGVLRFARGGFAKEGGDVFIIHVK
jgi:hypothetical protein